MDPEDEIATLKLRIGQLERELRTLDANYRVASSTANVAKHARDALSLEIVELRKRHRDLMLILAPLGLLLAQLEADPLNSSAWHEAKSLAVKAQEILERRAVEEAAPDTDPNITPPEMSPLVPEGAPEAPYPRTPSAMIPKYPGK